MSEPFIAEIRIFGSNFAPRGWAFCNGQLLPISQNTALFSLIGTTYGGDGRTTTALPDLQNRFPMGAGNGPGLTSRREGERTGAATVTLNESQIPSHGHSLRASPNEATTGTPSDEVGYAMADANVYGEALDPVVMAPETLSDTGAGEAHENRQAYLGMNFIIALQGTYPSRS